MAAGAARAVVVRGRSDIARASRIDVARNSANYRANIAIRDRNGRTSGGVMATHKAPRPSYREMAYDGRGRFGDAERSRVCVRGARLHEAVRRKRS